MYTKEPLQASMPTAVHWFWHWQQIENDNYASMNETSRQAVNSSHSLSSCTACQVHLPANGCFSSPDRSSNYWDNCFAEAR